MTHLSDYAVQHIPHGVTLILLATVGRYTWKAAMWVKDTKTDILEWADKMVLNHLAGIQAATEAVAKSQDEQAGLLKDVSEKLGLLLDRTPR